MFLPPVKKKNITGLLFIAFKKGKVYQGSNSEMI